MDNQVRPVAHDMWIQFIEKKQPQSTHTKNKDPLLVNNLIILIAMQLSNENCMCNLVMSVVLKRKLAIEYPSKNYT